MPRRGHWTGFALTVGTYSERAHGRAHSERERIFGVATPVRVAAVVVTVTLLRVAGLNPSTPAGGAAVTAVVTGLAAQQTRGNVIAGIVLIGVRPS